MTDSMAAQRFADFGKESARITARLMELHPDSPEALALREELRAKAEKLDGAYVEYMQELPLRTRILVRIISFVISTAQFIIKPCHRLFHMVRGLL